MGNKCYFFTGAAVLGEVTIGDDCVVGAHAVVTCDVPNGGLALGIPAKVYPDKGKEAILSWNV